MGNRTEKKILIVGDKVAKKILIVAIACAMMILTTACGDKGLDAAYEDFSKEYEKAAEEAKKNNEPATAPLTRIEYNEKIDRLYITLDEKADDPDEFFDKLDEYVEEEEIGELIFRQPYGSDDGAGHADFMKKCSERLGKLPCKSLRMLGLSTSLSDLGGAWTELLDKTDKLYMDNINVLYMDEYTEEEKARLAAVKKLAYFTDATTLNFSIFGKFSGVEELALSAGLTESQWNERNTKGFNLYEQENNVSYIQDYPQLKRLLIFPEANGWRPNDNYYRFAYMMKRLIPEVETNIPGSGKTATGEAGDAAADAGDSAAGSGGDKKDEDGSNADEEDKYVDPAETVELVKFKDYKILANATEDEKERILSDELKKDAKRCYKKGKKFKKKGGKPKLYGKCLIYYSEPYDSQFNKDKFYDMTPHILRKELGSKKIQVPDDIHDYRMFIYINGKYNFYGNYNKGTKGYTTKTMVTVYDMKKKIRYEPKEVNSENPPYSFTYYGSTPPKTHYPNLKIDKAKKYVKSLPYKAE